MNIRRGGRMAKLDAGRMGRCLRSVMRWAREARRIEARGKLNGRLR